MMNQEAHADFWALCNERHSIYLKRQAGKPWPWTDNLIMREWHFCNILRHLDRQSKWLIDNVLDPHANESDELLLFNIFAFRAFNWYPTYELFGWQDEWSTENIKKLLLEKIGYGGKLTSEAYMIRGFEGKTKMESIPEVLGHIWQERHDIAEALYKYPTLENAHSYIMSKHFWGWGPFTIYQIVLDLTYTHMLRDASDMNTWCVFGPGAERGLQDIWPGIKKKDYLIKTKELWAEQDKYRQSNVPVLSLQSVEWLLCELSKYIRIKAGGRGKVRYRHAI